MFSSNSSQVSDAANYIEDVYSTYLYTGTGATQTITNGIDLSINGGLTWIKGRSGATGHRLTDTARGVTKSLASETTTAEATETTGLTAFGTTGFTIGADADYNTSAATYVSWTFRKQSKFFDVVTYTGTGVNRTVAHNLNSVPGCIIVKRTDTAADWAVYHRSLTNTQYLVLNTAAAAATGATWWNSTTPTSAVFSLGTDASVNASGGTYVAYIFAHDAGGFGLAGTDNVISCGGGTTDVSGLGEVTLGYEPQYVMYRLSDTADDWRIYDTMRGWTVFDIQDDKQLTANQSSAETTGGQRSPFATGFNFVSQASKTFIYIAVRRGPMEVPTLGTSVFNSIARTGSPSYPLNVTGVGFPLDMAMVGNRQFASAVPGQGFVFDRLRGPTQYLFTNDNAAEGVNGIANSLLQDGYTITTDVPSGAYNFNTWTYIDWFFRRAPSFFDEVCYTGTATYTTFTHNLTVAPQLVIIKARSNGNAWVVGSSLSPSASDYIILSSTGAWISGSFWDNSSFVATRPTTTTVTISPDAAVNASGITFVAYLFATCAGVSKVGSYTGNGTTQTINCGFTGGARFVLIKRTDSTGDWYVYDTARGMTVLTDPYLLINSTAAEVATLGSVTTVSTGFALDSAILAAINVSAGTYIFLAIA